MIEYIVYGTGFFIVTLILQYILSQTGAFWRKGFMIWKGKECIIGMCILGLMFRKFAFFAAILGFIFGENVAISLGWHKMSRK